MSSASSSSSSSSSSASSSLTPSASKRLLRDFREISLHPLPTVTAKPLDDDLSQWHANLRPLSGPYAGVVFHFVLFFPRDYPSSPPSIKMCTLIEHPNVFRVRDAYARDQTPYICLDMLQPHTTQYPYQGWSSAYSVQSILLQLQSFLFAENIPQDYGGMARATTTAEGVSKSSWDARYFECLACGHTYDKPVPQFQYAVADDSGDDDSKSNDAHLAIVPKRFLEHDESIAQAFFRLLARREQRCKQEDDDGTAEQECAFDMLDEYMTAEVFLFLSWEDLHAVGRTCKFFASVLRRFPHLTERMQVSCFHTRMSFRETVLGFGIRVQYHNPRRRYGPSRAYAAIKAIDVELDYVSLSAFRDEGVRQGMWKGSFDLVLPVLLDRRHEERAWPFIERTLRALHSQPTEYGDRFVITDWFDLYANKLSDDDDQVLRAFDAESMALDTLCQLMNTMVVNMMNSASANITYHSEKALEGYCAFHHMLLAFALRYPSIVRVANNRVSRFVSNRKYRNKAYVPDMGAFLVLLTLSDASWEDVAVTALGEILDRQVRWYTRKQPELGDVVDLCAAPVDCRRLLSVREQTLTGQRLLMFQVLFIKRIARPDRHKHVKPGLPLARCLYDEYNRRFGKPQAGVTASLQRECSAIMEIDSWAGMFRRIGIVTPRPSRLTALLRAAVVRSRRKGYHRASDAVILDDDAIKLGACSGGCDCCHSVHNESEYQHTLRALRRAGPGVFDFESRFLRVRGDGDKLDERADETYTSAFDGTADEEQPAAAASSSSGKSRAAVLRALLMSSGAGGASSSASSSTHHSRRSSQASAIAHSDDDDNGGESRNWRRSAAEDGATQAPPPRSRWSRAGVSKPSGAGSASSSASSSTHHSRRSSRASTVACSDDDDDSTDSGSWRRAAAADTREPLPRSMQTNQGVACWPDDEWVTVRSKRQERRLGRNSRNSRVRRTPLIDSNQVGTVVAGAAERRKQQRQQRKQQQQQQQQQQQRNASATASAADADGWVVVQSKRSKRKNKKQNKRKNQ